MDRHSRLLKCGLLDFRAWEEAPKGRQNISSGSCPATGEAPHIAREERLEER
jgi:hypothetical protein